MNKTNKNVKTPNFKFNTNNQVNEYSLQMEFDIDSKDYSIINYDGSVFKIHSFILKGKKYSKKLIESQPLKDKSIQLNRLYTKEVLTGLITMFYTENLECQFVYLYELLCLSQELEIQNLFAELCEFIKEILTIQIAPFVFDNLYFYNIDKEDLFDACISLFYEDEFASLEEFIQENSPKFTNDCILIKIFDLLNVKKCVQNDYVNITDTIKLKLITVYFSFVEFESIEDRNKLIKEIVKKYISFSNLDIHEIDKFYIDFPIFSNIDKLEAQMKALSSRVGKVEENLKAGLNIETESVNNSQLMLNKNKLKQKDKSNINKNNNFISEESVETQNERNVKIKNIENEVGELKSLISSLNLSVETMKNEFEKFRLLSEDLDYFYIKPITNIIEPLDFKVLKNFFKRTFRLIKLFDLMENGLNSQILKVNLSDKENTLFVIKTKNGLKFGTYFDIKFPVNEDNTLPKSNLQTPKKLIK